MKWLWRVLRRKRSTNSFLICCHHLCKRTFLERRYLFVRFSVLGQGRFLVPAWSLKEGWELASGILHCSRVLPRSCSAQEWHWLANRVHLVILLSRSTGQEVSLSGNSCDCVQGCKPADTSWLLSAGSTKLPIKKTLQRVLLLVCQFYSWVMVRKFHFSTSAQTKCFLGEEGLLGQFLESAWKSQEAHLGIGEWKWKEEKLPPFAFFGTPYTHMFL